MLTFITLGTVGLWYWLLPDAPPQGFLQWEKVVFVEGNSEIRSGAVLGANVWSNNPGPTPVYNAYGYEEIIEGGVADKLRQVIKGNEKYLVNITDAQGLEEIINQKFEDGLKPTRDGYLKGSIKGTSEIGVAHGVWGTVYTHTLSDADVEAVVHPSNDANS